MLMQVCVCVSCDKCAVAWLFFCHHISKRDDSNIYRWIWSTWYQLLVYQAFFSWNGDDWLISKRKHISQNIYTKQRIKRYRIRFIWIAYKNKHKFSVRLCALQMVSGFSRLARERVYVCTRARVLFHSWNLILIRFSSYKQIAIIRSNKIEKMPNYFSLMAVYTVHSA